MDEFASVALSDTKVLGDLCTVISSGPSWAAADESSVPSEGALTVLKITNTRPDGSIDLSKLAYVTGLPARTKVIGPTSLVMIRTNGNRKRIGNVYLPPKEVRGAAVSAFQFILDALDAETRDYLYLVLRSPEIQNLMSASASGSTGLGNLAVRWLKTLEIPWPDARKRKSQVEVIGAVDDQIAALVAESEALEKVLDCLRAELPEAKQEPIGDVLLAIESGKSVQAGGEASPEDEYRILKISAVQRGWFKPSEAKALTNRIGFSPSHVVTNGDLLITRANTPHRVGFAAVAKNVPTGTFIPDLIWRLRVDDSRVSVHYLQYALSSRELRERISRTAGGTSSSMVKINKRGFSTVRVPIPSLPAQREYVRRCDAAAEAIMATRSEEARLREVRAGLLSSLLERPNKIDPYE